MKIAILGLTHPHAGILLTTFEAMPEITSVVLWDADPAVVAKPALPAAKKVSQVTADLDAVLAQPDLVFALVCARTDLSAALCARVIAAGKHLISEKPVGLTSAEIDGLAAAAARRGVVAGVLYPRRWHPCATAARDLIRSGTLGSLLTVEARFLTTQVKFRNPESWLFRRAQAGGGILLWLGCHVLDLIQFATNDPITEVGAAYATRSGEAIDVEDTAALALRFASGAVGTFHAGYTLAYSGAGYVNLAGYDSYLGFNAQAGRIVWPDLNPRLQIERPPVAGESPAREQKFDLPPSGSYGGQPGEAFLRQFFAAMAGKGDAPTSLADAARTARVLEAAEESARSGRFIRVAGAPAARTAGRFHAPPFAGEEESLAAHRRSLNQS